MEIQQGARIIVQHWLQAKPEDVLHFITDETKLREAKAFAQAAEAFGAFPKVTILPSDSIQAGDSIEEMRQIMTYADAIVGATNFSFITTNAVSYALKHGARFLSLPLSTNDGSSLLEQEFLRMSPGKAAALGRPMLRALRRADSIRVTTRLGTDITFDIRGRRPGLYNGIVPRLSIATRLGACASASFEVYVPPVETGTDGRVVLDGSMGYLGLVNEPLELRFEGGRLAEIADTADGRRLREYIESFGDGEMYCAAEFGIGLNQISRCRGASYIEDESTYGTFHIGFGRNLALGGDHDAAGHFDIVVHNPTIYAGEEAIMREGKAKSGGLSFF